MTPAQRKELERLLMGGLRHFGAGEVEQARECWNAVLAIDACNAPAREYLESVRQRPVAEFDIDIEFEDDDEEDTPQSVIRDFESEGGPVTSEREDDTPLSGVLPRPSSNASSVSDGRIACALKAFEHGDLAGAWTGLQAVAQEHPDRLDVQGYLALVRTRRAHEFVGEIGDLSRVLRLAVGLQDITGVDLKPEEGFLLAQMDGVASVEDLISISTTGRVETLEILAGLLRKKLVE